MAFQDLEVKIVPRVNVQGNQFTEVLYTWTEGGSIKHALTRYWYPMQDTPHARANERAGFLRRMGR